MGHASCWPSVSPPTTVAKGAQPVSGSAAVVTLAERDPIDPLPRDVRASIARRLFEGAGFAIGQVDDVLRSIDPAALMARRP